MEERCGGLCRLALLEKGDTRDIGRAGGDGLFEMWYRGFGAGNYLEEETIVNISLSPGGPAILMVVVVRYGHGH